MIDTNLVFVKAGCELEIGKEPNEWLHKTAASVSDLLPDERIGVGDRIQFAGAEGITYAVRYDGKFVDLEGNSKDD